MKPVNYTIILLLLIMNTFFCSAQQEKRTISFDDLFVSSAYKKLMDQCMHLQGQCDHYQKCDNDSMDCNLLSAQLLLLHHDVDCLLRKQDSITDGDREFLLKILATLVAYSKATTPQL